MITFAVAFSWPLFHAMPETAWLSLPGILVIPMWMAAPFGLSVLFKSRFGLVPGALALIALVLVMELGLRRGPLAFPWSLLGHTQAEMFPVNQLASLGGVPLLTLFVLVANLCATWIAAGISGRVRAALPVGVLVAAALIGVGLFAPPEGSKERAPTWRIGLVQPGFPATAWADLDDESRLDTLLLMSESLLTDESHRMAEATAAARAVRFYRADIDVILWPETSLPPHASSRARVQRRVDTSGVPILTGAILDSGAGSYYNAALLFQPHVEVQTYRKERLVPFAERVPLQDRWPWLRRLAVPSGGVAGYARGSGNDLLEIPNGSFGVAICFESLFDDVISRYARRGASLVVILTQDGWWGDSFGYRQHAAFNRLRAIESGLTMVQASVSGISGIIGPDGRMSDRVGWMEQSGRVVTISDRSTNTAYVRFGDWISVIALFAIVVATFVLVLQTYVARKYE